MLVLGRYGGAVGDRLNHRHDRTLSSAHAALLLGNRVADAVRIGYGVFPVVEVVHVGEARTRSRSAQERIELREDAARGSAVVRLAGDALVVSPAVAVLPDPTEEPEQRIIVGDDAARIHLSLGDEQLPGRRHARPRPLVGVFRNVHARIRLPVRRRLLRKGYLRRVVHFARRLDTVDDRMTGDRFRLGLERTADDSLIFGIGGVSVPLALGRRTVAVDAGKAGVHRRIVRVRRLLEKSKPEGLDKVKALFALRAELVHIWHRGVLLQIVGNSGAGNDGVEALLDKVGQDGIDRRP